MTTSTERGEPRIGVRTYTDVDLALNRVATRARETPQFRAGVAAAYQWALSRTERSPITGADAGGTPDLPILTAEVDAALVQLGDPAIPDGNQEYVRGAHDALAWLCGQSDRAA
ncbi:hypothetical protein ACF06X_12650 [Streptomyces sp. NPDC015346]|uniref:hypothetical protein n=1 Tax=Streptomyces sp. NPDC015346 TaxID=3364954 RepID=UPI0036F91812